MAESVAVGASTWQHADNLDGVGVIVVAQTHPPLTNSKTIRVIRPLEPGDVAQSRLCVASHGLNDSASNLTLKPA